MHGFEFLDQIGLDIGAGKQVNNTEQCGNSCTVVPFIHSGDMVIDDIKKMFDMTTQK